MTTNDTRRIPAAVWLADGGRDLLLALRAARRQPAFTLFIVLTLGLGIGANSAMFGILDRLLLSPPPYVTEPEALARVLVERTPRDGARFSMSTVSYPAFIDLSGASSFSAVAAATTGNVILGRGEAARPVLGGKVSGGYFALLGARPLLGRFFSDEEDQPPAGTAVAVVGHTFWKRDLGGEASALGREIVVNGVPYTVIGVAPPGFTGDGIAAIDVWIPLHAGMASAPSEWRDDRMLRLVSMLGRLRPGVSREAAAHEATALYRAGLESMPFLRGDDRIGLAPLIAGWEASGVSLQGRITLWLSGVALVVFVIALANVTNLLLQRAAQRQQEIAVRLALGMGRLRLARQWVTETLLLAVLGGAVGLLIARWGGELVRLTLLPYMGSAEGPANGRVLAVTVATVLAAGVITGLLPALQASSPRLAEVLKSGREAQTFRRSPLRTGLLLAQTGLSVVLLVGSGLFVRSFHNVRTQDFGFDLSQTLLVTLEFDAHVPAAVRDSLYRGALERVKTVPGVEKAIPVDTMPFGSTSAPAMDVPGVDMSQFPQTPFLNAAAPEYFEVLGMRLLRGRGITAADGPGSAPVVVVSDTMARSIWPGQDPLGRCVRIGFVADPAEAQGLPCREVVGVVNDARPRSIVPEALTIMQFYVPYEQVPPPPMEGIPTIQGLLLRSSGKPESLVRPVQAAVHSVAPGLPYVNARPYASVIDPQTHSWRLGATLFSAFGGLALVMASIGLYGVLAYMVARRSREMGIRMALGAQPGNVVALVVREGLWFAAIGLAAGGAAALAAGSWVKPLLFETDPWDPTVLGGVALTLALVAVLASLLPALRATRADPNLALRAE